MGGSNGAGPFDKLADLATWADILEPADWGKVEPGDAATLEAWQHPAATHPISAKVLKTNPHVLVVWSDDCGLPAGADQKNTKGRVYATNLRPSRPCSEARPATCRHTYKMH